MAYTSDKRLYLTSDGQVVEEGDERAATLLVGEGGQLSDEQAAQYGLGSAPAATPKSDVSAAESEDGSRGAKAAAKNTKAVNAPQGNK
jgi:hypothetical protein